MATSTYYACRAYSKFYFGNPSFSKILKNYCENKVSGKITFVETQGREDLYDVSFNNNITIRSIQPSENRVELNSDVNWGIMKEGLLLFDKNGKRLK